MMLEEKKFVPKPDAHHNASVNPSISSGTSGASTHTPTPMLQLEISI
jgi:hypothetical protein